MYDTYVPPEINVKKGGILLLGRDPGEQEVQQKRPFVGLSGQLLGQMLKQAGLKREDVNLANVVPYRPKGNEFKAHSRRRISDGLHELRQLIKELEPSVIVAFGNEASYAVVTGWPGATIRSASGIEDRRGYVFDGIEGVPVVPTIHPAAVLRQWVPWRMVVPRDIAKAVGDLTRPVREVRVVDTDEDVRDAVAAIENAELTACDIETTGTDRLACVGFASSPCKAWVFPPPRFADAFKILESGYPFVFANGQYDMYFLLTRNGIKTNFFEHDTQVAWHSCYPELAGKSDQKTSKATRKSLSFLSSLFTNDEWWKDYDFASEDERYELNGMDCCITLDVMQNLLPVIKGLGVEKIYDLELSLVWPCIMMQSRGLLVDENKRQAAIDELERRHDKVLDEIQKIAIPLLEGAKDKIPRWALFEEVWTCPCCRNGSGKRERCWNCAGFLSKPNKSDLIEAYGGEGTVSDLTTKFLGPCKVCKGKGQTVVTAFKPTSDTQQKILLYDVLRFKKRHKKGKLRSDEAALKDMLGEVRNENQKKIIELILKAQKLQGMRSHYNRIAPGEDGRIRTVLSVGTDTGRFVSKATFLEASTNLQNLPKKSAVADPLFEVRTCIVPERGRVLCEADFSSAERRLLAYLANEKVAIEQIEKEINSYKWFAAKIFGISDWRSIDKANPIYHIGKMCVLALDRGVAWRKLKEQINKDADITGASVTAAQSKKAEALFHGVFKGYRRYHKEVRNEIARKGYLINVVGRRRDFFGRRGDQTQLEAVGREGVSFLAQAIGDIINEVLERLYRQHDPSELRLLLQIHDSIIFDAPKATYKRACKLVKEEMEKPITLPTGQKIIIPAEVQATNTNWGEMKDV